MHRKIKPFLILLAAPPGVGLSSFTTLYASQLCVSNIVSTTLIFQTLKILQNEKWNRISKIKQNSLERYKEICKFVRQGTYFDISKVFKDGKSMILEGS